MMYLHMSHQLHGLLWITKFGSSASDTDRKEERNSHSCGAPHAQQSILQAKKPEAHYLFLVERPTEKSNVQYNL